MRCSRTTTTSSAGAPTSAAARSASTCRSTSSWPNDFFAQAVIVAKDVEARERLQAKLEKLLAEDFPEAVGRTSPLELGPPVGWPVQYRVSGPDMDEVRDIALELAQVVADQLRTHGASTSTGSSRRASCASASTRTRRAGSA